MAHVWLVPSSYFIVQFINVKQLQANKLVSQKLSRQILNYFRCVFWCWRFRILNYQSHHHHQDHAAFEALSSSHRLLLAVIVEVEITNVSILMQKSFFFNFAALRISFKPTQQTAFFFSLNKHNDQVETLRWSWVRAKK